LRDKRAPLVWSVVCHSMEKDLFCFFCGVHEGQMLRRFNPGEA
jgi:hypothetical protein